jgi:hypothetical protein
LPMDIMTVKSEKLRTAMVEELRDNGLGESESEHREMNEIYDQIDAVFQTKTLNLYVSILYYELERRRH